MTIMKLKNNEPAGTLMLQALAYLKEDQSDLLHIHKGSGIPFYWLREFKAERIRNPSVNRVQKLIEYYIQKPLTF